MNPTNTWFTDEFERRKSANSRYSIRAFARDLGVSKSTIWEVVSGKRLPSRIQIEQIAKKLGYSPAETANFLEMLGFQDGKARAAAVAKDLEVAEDEFRLFADWYYLAILNLAACDDNHSDPEHIAKRLNLTPHTVRVALKRLTKMGLLKIQNKKLQRQCLWIETTHEVPSAAIRLHHRQILGKAIETIEQVEIDKRHFESLTFAIAPSQLPTIKRMIRRFGDRVAKTAEKGNKKEVYAFAMQFFPISHDHRITRS